MTGSALGQMSRGAAFRATVALTGTWTRRLLRPGRAIGLTLLCAAPALVLAVSAGQTTAAGAGRLAIDIAATVLLAMALPVTAVVLASDVFGAEVEDRTLGFWTLTPLPRSLIAIAGVLAATAATVAITLVGWAALIGVLAVRGSLPGPAMALLAGLLIGVLAYTAVFVPVGLVLRRSTAAGLIYVLVWEGAIVGLIGTLAPTSLSRYGLAAMAGTLDAPPRGLVAALGSLQPGLVAPVTAVVVLLVAATALTTWLLSTRDVS